MWDAQASSVLRELQVNHLLGVDNRGVGNWEAIRSCEP